MEKIKLSVCIPTYNRASILVTTLLNLLNQDLTGIEIIVSDNNSTDNTSEAVSGLINQKIKYFKNDLNFGATINLLITMKQAQGDFVVTLSDEDDLNLSNIMMTIATCERLDNKVGLILGGVEKPSGTKYLYKNKLIFPKIRNLYLYGYKRAYMSGIVFRREFLNLDSYFLETKKPNNGYLGLFPHTSIINAFLIRYLTLMSNTTFACVRDRGTHDHQNVGFSTTWVHPKGRMDQYNSEKLFILEDEKLKTKLFSEFFIFNRYRVALGYIAAFYTHYSKMDYYFDKKELNTEVYDLSHYTKYKNIHSASYDLHIKRLGFISFTFFAVLKYLASIWTYYKHRIYLLKPKI